MTTQLLEIPVRRATEDDDVTHYWDDEKPTVLCGELAEPDDIVLEDDDPTPVNCVTCILLNQINESKILPANTET